MFFACAPTQIECCRQFVVRLNAVRPPDGGAGAAGVMASLFAASKPVPSFCWCWCASGKSA